jgi:hypothetical protein
MIQKITTRYFKRFATQEFPIKALTLLAGPNNSGKSTLLQAVMVWNLAMQKWLEKKGPESGSKAKDRQGAPITRQEFSALPLPSMDQLWTDTHTSLRKDEGKQGAPRPMVITLHGSNAKGDPWKLGFEFRYSGPEQIHVKPVAEDLPHLVGAQNEVSVIYVPPFSGIGVNETRYDRPYQDMLVGQGKGGDILRNLLLEVAEKKNDGADWDRIQQIVEDVFGYRLVKPVYAGTPYITSQYLKGLPKGNGLGGYSPLDVSTAGSGFHQVLLILAFLFARPSSLILLDEPDAHLHVVLQKQLFDILRNLCRERSSQLVIATHSEVLIDNTGPDQIVSFYRTPYPLASEVDRQQLAEALKRVTSLELLSAENSQGILYLEGTTDFDLLKAWAGVLEHPLQEWFKRPFWHNNQGRIPKEARAHFFSLKAIRPDIKAALLLDGDNRNAPDRELTGESFTVLRWDRYEAESYLLHPNALERFLANEMGSLFADAAMSYLQDQLPPAFFKNPLDTTPFLRSEPVSKTLLPELLERASLPLSKNNYYQIAQQMKPEEISSEVKRKLDEIYQVVGTVQVNAA